MKYTVIWTPHALEQLAELWLEAVDQRGFTEAADTLEKFLRDDPLHQRHEIVDGTGTAVKPPIGIDFRVSEADQIVSVFAVWLVEEDVL
jgi:hypothetical protein